MGYLRPASLLVFFLVALFSFLAIVACGDNDEDTSDNGSTNSDDDLPAIASADVGDTTEELAYSFPEGFLFGAATAGFQVDMGCPTLPPEQCDDIHSDWYGFVTSPETIAKPLAFVSGESPSVIGPGHWELYESDLDLVKNELKNNGFRMSIEWSRIFPEPTFGIEGHDNLLAIADSAAVAHYHDVFDALAQRGITPLVTIHHYTLPDWIHDGVGCTIDLDSCTERGWLEPDVIIPEIVKYAGFVAKEFGAEVDLWATHNEPLAVPMPGYLLPTPHRTNPPAVAFHFDDFKTSLNAIIESHARMYDAVKAGDLVDADNDGESSFVGLIYALAPVRPIDPENPLDVEAAENILYLWNLAFLDAVALGMFDEDFNGEQVYREDLANRMDYIGVNYKVRVATAGLSFSVLPWLSPLFTANPFSLIFDEIYTPGIYEMVNLVKERYGLPSIVTENNGQSIWVDDMEGEKRYLVEHLSWLSLAIEEGADVRGYFYWSLMDNYEWNMGSGKPLGFYEVDPYDPEKKRIPRETVDMFATICEHNGIPKSMAEMYPITPE